MNEPFVLYIFVNYFVTLNLLDFQPEIRNSTY